MSAAPDDRPLKGDLKVWALIGAREYLDNWDRVSSIIGRLTDHLYIDVQDAETRGDDKIDALRTDILRQNIDWLVSLMDEHADKLRKDLLNAGVKS